MSKREPAFNIDNLAILLNTLLGLSRLWLFPLIALCIALLLLILLPTYRVAGGLIAVLAAIYAYVEEYVLVSPKSIVEEIRNDPTMQYLRKQGANSTAIELSDKLLNLTENAHRPVLRTVQTFLAVAGGLMGLFGDDSQYIVDWFHNLIRIK